MIVRSRPELLNHLTAINFDSEVDVDAFFEQPNSSKGRKLFGKFVPLNSKAFQTETKKKDEIGEQQIAAKEQILLQSEADEEKIAEAVLDCTSNKKNAGKSVQENEEKETEVTEMGEEDKTMKLNLEVDGGESSSGTVTAQEPIVLLKVSYPSLQFSKKPC